MLAARAAAWTPAAPGADLDAPEESRGPLWETTEAERCAAMALGVP